MAMSESSLKAMFDYVPSYLAETKWPLPNALLSLSNQILGSLPPEIEKPENGLCLLLPYIESLTGQALTNDRALVRHVHVHSSVPSPKPTRPVRNKAPNRTQYADRVLEMIADCDKENRNWTVKEEIEYVRVKFKEETGIDLNHEQIRNWYIKRRYHVSETSTNLHSPE